MLSRTPWICASCLRSATQPLRVSQTLRKSLPRQQFRRQTTSSTSPDQFNPISPALLSRAQTLAAEHADLTATLATSYSPKSAKRHGELSRTVSALTEYTSAQSSLTELESLLTSPDAELASLAADDLAPSQSRLAAASHALKSSLTRPHPFAHLPCLLEIRPGAGGDEAALFAGDLLRMYTAYCHNVGLATTLLKRETADYSSATGSGDGTSHVQEAVLEVGTPGAYGVLRCEAGVHRVQRVPATEKQGRTHTSAASVLVLPVMEEGAGAGEELGLDDPKSDYYVDVKDVRSEVMRASGAGGQHVNKTESAVRLTHVPSGTVVFVQESRSQLKNREKAWTILRGRLAQQRREEREEELVRLRRGAGAGKVGRENKIRTYNWGQQRVSDHRSGIDSRHLDDIMEGGDSLEKVMQSVRQWMEEQEIQALTEEEEANSKGK